MKTYKISFFISLLLLCWSICYTPQLKSAEQSPVNSIQQSPLSDDQTDPINTNSSIEFAEIDLRRNDESLNLHNNPVFSPILNFNIIESSFMADSFPSTIKKSNRVGLQHLLHSSDSYLSVFRI